MAAPLSTLNPPTDEEWTASVLNKAVEIVESRQEDTRKVMEGAMPRREVTIKDSGLDDDLVELFNASEGNPLPQAVVLLWQSTRNTKHIVDAVDRLVAALAGGEGKSE